MATGCCPLCDKPGNPVKSTTVKAITKNKENLSSQTFFICMTPDCKVVYYSAQNTYTVDYIKNPISFKEGVDPKYICYCAKVTEKDIIKAIKEGAGTLKKVIQKTGAMQNSNCETKNPTGQCCANQIKVILNDVQT
ncbi:MAG: (2Fe-2S)-binding protein [Bacillota bacterium]|nr:(2Fe-2S)-binding protein [Bacillota bacterium]MDW7683589.1 (2Fe-2S)-binding protein [Bacillota bacterium]